MPARKVSLIQGADGRYNLFLNSNVHLPAQRRIVGRLYWQVSSSTGSIWAEVDASGSRSL